MYTDTCLMCPEWTPEKNSFKTFISGVIHFVKKAKSNFSKKNFPDCSKAQKKAKIVFRLKMKLFEPDKISKTRKKPNYKGLPHFIELLMQKSIIDVRSFRFNPINPYLSMLRVLIKELLTNFSADFVENPCFSRAAQLCFLQIFNRGLMLLKASWITLKDYPKVLRFCYNSNTIKIELFIP